MAGVNPAGPPNEVPSDAPDEKSGTLFEGQLLQAFRESFVGSASFVVRAPGRINLIGEHTDYNQGFVLPMAIDRSLWIALRPRDDRHVVLRSLDYRVQRSFDLGQLRRGEEGWFEYVKGTAWALADAGLPLRGWEGVLAGEIPQGAGLASSAALEVATARAFAAVSEILWDPMAAARLGQRAENEWVGVHCGIMDQLIVACATEGHALLIDCRDLETAPRPLPPATAVVVLDTSTRRGLEHSRYNERRARCEEAARSLGVPSLRDLSWPAVDRMWARLPDGLRCVARHVVTENARTLEAADAMNVGDAVRLGRLMDASHNSLRDDFGVSSAALEAMVFSARESIGCYGARLTGAGFAGCVVALVEAARRTSFSNAAATAFLRRTGLEPAVYSCRPVAGASATPVS